jgi:hypothetical protein
MAENSLGSAIDLPLQNTAFKLAETGTTKKNVNLDNNKKRISMADT